jgi:Uma2 family endonuclease
MTALTKPRMTVDEYLAWAETEPGRYELHRGQVYTMSPENAGHAEIKFAVHRALFAAIRAAKLTCHVLPDGMTVRIDQTTAYEPGAVIYSGEKISRSAVEVPNPAIVVEVLSPSTRQFDVSIKLAGYFRLPSVAHYLIVDPSEPMVVHHARGVGADIITRVVTEGTIALDPPGLDLAVEDIYTA